MNLLNDAEITLLKKAGLTDSEIVKIVNDKDAYKKCEKILTLLYLVAKEVASYT